MKIYIPPNGFLGQAQQTTANQLVGVRAARNGNGKRRKRRTAAAKRAPMRRKRSSSSKRPARLVKGSAAAKRYMAKIRRKRRK